MKEEENGGGIEIKCKLPRKLVRVRVYIDLVELVLYVLRFF